MPANPLADTARRWFVHHLGPPRRGVHVAMAAGLVALPADVELQRLQARPTKRPMMLGQLLFKAVHESKGMISPLRFLFHLDSARSETGAIRLRYPRLAIRAATERSSRLAGCVSSFQ